MSQDWFRKTSWTNEDSEDFFAHLKRSRQYNRSQYLRIQASHLAGVGTPEMTKKALSLLEILFEEYPDRLEMASAYLQKAECLVDLGRVAESIEFFKKSIDFQRGFPNVGTQAPIIFGLTVVENDLLSEFGEVIRILDEFGDDLITFPIDEYHVFAIRAIIETQKGSRRTAMSLAEKAVEASKKIHSGFRYHASLGLVKDLNTKLHRKLNALIGSS